MSDLQLEKLFYSGAHFGHLSKFCNKKMLSYVYGTVSKMSVIDLRKTMVCFKHALVFIEKTVISGGKVLFVGTKQCTRDLVEEFAIKCGMSYINKRWLGGLLTNFNYVKKSVGCLNELKRINLTLNKSDLTKIERMTLSRRLRRLSLNFNGILEMSTIPELLFVIDVNHNKAAIREANSLKIPVIGIVDTDSTPIGVDFVIPGNDDSINAIRFYLEVVSKHIIDIKNRNITNKLL